MAARSPAVPNWSPPLKLSPSSAAAAASVGDWATSSRNCAAISGSGSVPAHCRATSVNAADSRAVFAAELLEECFI